jgi:hypothetical protein
MATFSLNRKKYGARLFKYIKTRLFHERIIKNRWPGRVTVPGKRRNVMKKQMLNYLAELGVIILILLAVSMFAFGFGQENSVTTPPGPTEYKVRELAKQLNLSGAQTAKVREILEKAHEQALNDRETFKTNAVELVSAARRRRRKERQSIRALLKPGQLEIYKKTDRPEPMDRELFMLTEGLLLNGDQAFTVEGILIEHYERFRDVRPAMRTGMRTGGGMGRMGRRLRGIMKTFNARKNKAIKKLLTKPQKKLYKQLQKDLEKKRKKRRKEMRKRRFR